MKNPKEHLICGARSRSNSNLPCKLKPLTNGRCRFHGGKTPIKHGRYSNVIRCEKKYIKSLIRLSNALLKN